MKKKLIDFFYYALVAIILVPSSILSMVYMSSYYHKEIAPPTALKSDESRRIEYYMHNDIMYINIDQLEIEYESNDEVLKFESFDSLAYYVSEVSSKEVRK